MRSPPLSGLPLRSRPRPGAVRCAPRVVQVDPGTTRTAAMALFNKKSPMEKWRSRNPVAADLADATGWPVDLDTGVVHTVIDGTTVVVMLTASGVGPSHGVGVIIEAGAQAERTLANTFGDDGGEPFDFDGWAGAAAPGSGLIDTHAPGGPELNSKVVAAAQHLVTQIS